MKLIEIYFFANGTNISADKFNRNDVKHFINIDAISCISELLEKPVSSSNLTKKYAYIRMTNGDQYYLKEESYYDFLKLLDKINYAN